MSVLGNEMEKKKVLLITRLDLIGFSRLPQVLHTAGCHVTLLSPAGLAIGSTRFVDEHILASATSPALINQFKAHLAERGSQYDLVIIGDETLLHEIAQQRGEDWLDACFPVNHRSRAVDLITSKFEFLQAAAASGLSVPELHICQTRTEAEQVAASFGYPVVLKLASGLSGSGVRVVKTPAELASNYNEMSAGQPVAVQRFATGRLGTTEVLFDHGKPICWASYYILQGWPTIFTSSCVREVMAHRDIESLVTGIGSLTGFHGLGGVDWIHDPFTGSLELIEFNPRPAPGYREGRLAGVSFSAGVRAMLNGAPVVQRPSSAGRKVIMFPQAIYRAVDDRDLWLLIRALKDLPWNDPLLAMAHLRRICSHYLPVRLRQWVKSLRGRSVKEMEA